MRAILERTPLRELAVYSLIGASGYVVNLAVFQLVYAAGASHLVAATAAFLVAVTNNFLLNRRWTFPGATEGAKRVQAPRFLAVSVAAFAVSLGVLEILVSVVGLPAIVAQACAVLIVTPIGFVGQKLWSFRRRPVVRVASASASASASAEG